MAFSYDVTRADWGARKARAGVGTLDWSAVTVCDLHWPGSNIDPIGTDREKIGRLLRGWQA